MLNNIIKTLIMLLILADFITMQPNSYNHVLLKRYDDKNTDGVISSLFNDVIKSHHNDNNTDDVISEKGFVQDECSGNCCLFAAVGTLPSNIEQCNKVVPPSGQNRWDERTRFVFNIHKFGKLHRFAIDVVSLPVTSENELDYSGSENNNMVGLMLEKALVDLHFDGEYPLSDGVAPTSFWTLSIQNIITINQ